MEGRPESQKFAVDASKPDPESDFTIGDAVAVRYTRRWPLSVIIGQVFLLAISFGFFGAVRVKWQIPLETRLVDLAQSNPQVKTFFVTFFATAISVLSSYLFTKAVQHAIRVYLTCSGWTSLITPIQIVVLTPLYGTEIDLISDAFSDRFDDL
ncbi:hypothetical protein B0H13DRAFT_2667115 [Mycena leptocephala]|nr:hypothetical protein B0H13DRAFT_2667115 [Mycena leptocephala]